MTQNKEGQYFENKNAIIVIYLQYCSDDNFILITNKKKGLEMLIKLVNLSLTYIFYQESVILGVKWPISPIPGMIKINYCLC